MFQTMSGRHAYLLALVLSVASVSSAGAQDALQPARIQAKASRRQPALGLPKRLDSQTDPVVWYVSGEWKGADSLKGVPFWTMAQVSEPTQGGEMTATEHLCPYSEFDPGLDEGADGEIDYDWEADYRDMG